jgi:structural maintenance of chromosome 1
MGLRSSFLRSSNLKQLIYNGEKSQISAYVTVNLFFNEKLVFETNDEEEIHFTRTISSSGNSEYKINDKVCSATDYDDKLKSFSILTSARNFLVFQVFYLN